jgi:hypothetical protein
MKPSGQGRGRRPSKVRTVRLQRFESNSIVGLLEQLNKMFLDFSGELNILKILEQWNKVQDLYDNSLFSKHC